MTNKMFYLEAANEVERNEIDQALWIKVTAEMPDAQAAQRNAKYIQLRAQELSVEATKAKASSAGHAFSRALKWCVIIALLLLLVTVVAMYVATVIEGAAAITTVQQRVTQVNQSAASGDESAYQKALFATLAPCDRFNDIYYSPFGPAAGSPSEVTLTTNRCSTAKRIIEMRRAYKVEDDESDRNMVEVQKSLEERKRRSVASSPPGTLPLEVFLKPAPSTPRDPLPMEPIR